MHLRALGVLASLLNLPAVSALAQSPTAFTYQGQLLSGGQPGTGSYDLRFRLYDAATGGAQIGSVQCADNVAVAGGLFTALIDFGAVFNDTPRWLEIGVRPDSTAGNCGAGTYTAVSPRQRVSAAPVASYALNYRTPHALDAADGLPVNALFVGNQGYVGIGTTAPQAPLDVRAGDGSYVRVDPVNGDLHGNGGTDGFFGIYNDGPSTGSTEIIYNNTVLFRVLNTGWVGIGATPVPGARLTVGGRIVMAPQTRYCSLHGAAFVPPYGATPTEWNSGLGVVNRGDAIATPYLAPVTLPHGAVVTEVRAVYRNSRTNVGFPCHFGRVSLSTGSDEIMAQLDGGFGGGTQLRTVATTAIGAPTIDNANYVYYAAVRIMFDSSSAMQSLLGFRITYTVTEPAP